MHYYCSSPFQLLSFVQDHIYNAYSVKTRNIFSRKHINGLGKIINFHDNKLTLQIFQKMSSQKE